MAGIIDCKMDCSGHNQSYTPASYDPIKKYPAVVVAHPNGRVRLQMASLWRVVINKYGGDVTVVHLPETGIKGNTHFPFSDLNNVHIADLIGMVKNKEIRLDLLMKKLAAHWFILNSIFFMLSSCSKAAETLPGNCQLFQYKKVLIIYLSRTNNTKAVAEIIHKKVVGELVALELVTPYPEHYQTTVKQVANENATGFLPLLKTKIDSIEKYDVVFIGFPTWGMQLPPPMKSFLNQYDLSEKTVIPFNTNGGYGIGNSFETVKKLCPKSKILEGFTTSGGSERDGIFYVMEGEKGKQVQDDIQRWLYLFPMSLNISRFDISNLPSTR